jgi:preprotein translocase subunit SecE
VVPVKKVIKFFKDSYGELRKVIWPTKEEVASSTKIVIISVIIFAVVLGFVDYLLLLGVDLIF